MDDFTGPRERSDLGFVNFDLSADILSEMFLYFLFREESKMLELPFMRSLTVT